MPLSMRCAGLYSMGTRSENDTAQDCIFRNGGGNHGDGSLNLLNGLDQIGALQFDVVGSLCIIVQKEIITARRHIPRCDHLSIHLELPDHVPIFVLADMGTAIFRRSKYGVLSRPMRRKIIDVAAHTYPSSENKNPRRKSLNALISVEAPSISSFLISFSPSSSFTAVSSLPS